MTSNMQSSDAIEPLGYSIPVAAEVISRPPVSRATMYRMIKSGDLETVKIGKRTLVTSASIRKLMVKAA